MECERIVITLHHLVKNIRKYVMLYSLVLSVISVFHLEKEHEERDGLAHYLWTGNNCYIMYTNQWINDV
jgi:hypothetical protein